MTTTNAAVRRLHNDLQALRGTTASEKKTEASLKKAGTTEKATLASIATQQKAIVDAFSSPTAPPDAATAQQLLAKMFTLGEKQVQTTDKFEKAQATDKKAIAKDNQSIKSEHKTALKALKPAEFHMSLKDTNRVRNELGLRSVKKAIREPVGTGADAIKAAKSVFGRTIQDLKYSGPLAKYLDKWPSDHVCCANFVSACLEKAGMIKPSEHSDNVSGLASNLANSGNFKRVSSSNMQPGDVVCFNVPGEGPMSHVEMFEGYKNGEAVFIGSNNRNADGSQRISDGPVGYPIGEVLRHK